MKLSRRIEEDRIRVSKCLPGEWNPDWPESDPWKVTIQRRVDGGPRVLTVDFYTGPGLRERMADGPSAEDVLECLLSDAVGVENARDFDDWAGDYGYDTDSRKALATYQATRRNTAKLRKFLGSEYDDYLYRTDG